MAAVHSQKLVIHAITEVVEDPAKVRLTLRPVSVGPPTAATQLYMEVSATTAPAVGTEVTLNLTTP